MKKFFFVELIVYIRISIFFISCMTNLDVQTQGGNNFEFVDLGVFQNQTYKYGTGTYPSFQ